MARPVFVDANIPMYAAGAAHPHKEPSLRLLQRIADGRLKAVTDAEVLQEILYRFWALRLPAEGIKIVDHFVTAVPAVLAVTKRDALRAKILLGRQPSLSPRDAIHAAVLLNNGLNAIHSYDRHFDSIPGIERTEPKP